jgi:hypothetical protein
MKLVPSKEYLEKAKLLSREEAEQLLARMRRKMMRRIEDKDTSALEAVALQLEKEDADLAEWRERWAEISARENKKQNMKG